MNLPNVSVPDISAYQRYLPDDWNAELVGGSGSLDGEVSMSAGALDFDLTLHADDAAVRLADNAFQSGFTLGLKAKGTADATTARVDVSGTFVELDNSRVLNKKGDTSKPWQTRFAVTTGEADFILPEKQDAKTGVIGFWSLFQNKELKSMLSDVERPRRRRPQGLGPRLAHLPVPQALLARHRRCRGGEGRPHGQGRPHRRRLRA